MNDTNFPRDTESPSLKDAKAPTFRECGRKVMGVVWEEIVRRISSTVPSRDASSTMMTAPPTRVDFSEGALDSVPDEPRMVGCHDDGRAERAGRRGFVW